MIQERQEMEKNMTIIFMKNYLTFQKRNGTGFHPMVSAEGIKTGKKLYLV